MFIRPLVGYNENDSKKSMKNILYQSNIISEKDVVFINSLYDVLLTSNYRLILIGWNVVPKEWNLKPFYLQIPYNLNYFKSDIEERKISEEFEGYGISLEFLLDRFQWWFDTAKSEEQTHNRIHFLYFHLHFYLKLIKEYNPSLILIWNGNESRQFILSTLADKFKINKMFFERGPLPATLFYDSEGILGNSSFVKNNILNDSFINNKENLFSNYISWYNKTTETLWEQPEKKDNIGIREKFNIPKDKKITLFIGQVDEDVQNKMFNPYFESNIEAFKWFLNNNSNQDYFILGKHHPKSKITINEYQSKIEDNKLAAWTDELILEEALKIADNVVTVNSSVVFDALIYKLPTLILGQTLLNSKNVTYEFRPEKFNEILNAFYNKENHVDKVENFNRLIKYLFQNHLLFLNDPSETNKLANVLCSKAIDEKLHLDCSEHDFYIFHYLNNVNNTKIITREPNLTFKEKLKKDIKWYGKKIFKFLNR